MKQLRGVLVVLLGLALAFSITGAALAQGESYTVSGIAYFDRNGNGLREAASEPLLEGMVIIAIQPGNNLVSRSIADGTYSVANLRAGNYTLQATHRDGQRDVLISPARAVTVTANVTGTDLGLRLPITPHDQRYFAQTGYRIDNEHIWNYFQARGGVDTFGFPVSRAFQHQGIWTQIFQRHVISVQADTRPMNLLDPGLLPATRLNGSTFPTYDASLANQAPPPSTPDYGNAVLRHLQATVPNDLEGRRVNFLEYYLDAAPSSAQGVPALVALEIWGFPTSHPMRDPNNNNFVYQRFQRGILHFDAATGVTRGILLGDAFKSLMTNTNLPPDLAQDMATSPYLGLYDPTKVNATRAAQTSPLGSGLTNLSYAFIPD